MCLECLGVFVDVLKVRFVIERQKTNTDDLTLSKQVNIINILVNNPPTYM